MKVLGAFLVAMAIFLSGPLYADTESGTFTVEKLFVPQGFDSNDDAEVWMYGYLNTPCNSIAEVAVDFDEQTREIVLEPVVRSEGRSTTFCPTVIKPVLRNVKLGQLEPGDYLVRTAGADDGYALVISPARRSDVDEHFYAPVEQVTAKAGADTVRIYGRYPLMLHGCAFIDEVRVDRDADDLVTIQPIMTIGYDRECTDHKIEFGKNVVLSEPLPDESLIHVRTINGTSTNAFIGEALSE